MSWVKLNSYLAAISQSEPIEEKEGDTPKTGKQPIEITPDTEADMIKAFGIKIDS